MKRFNIYLLLGAIAGLLGIIFISLVGLIIYAVVTVIKQDKANKNQKIEAKYEIEYEPIKPEPVKHEPTPKPSSFFKVAGTFLPERQEILKEFFEKNKKDYGKSNWKGLSNYTIENSGKRYYEYGFVPVNSRAKLVHEPDNEHDANAIAVYIGWKKDKKIGYVPKSDIKRVNQVMADENKKSFKFRLGGGRYKEYDEETNEVKIVNGEYNGFVFYHDYY